jgi:hypothetical protein
MGLFDEEVAGAAGGDLRECVTTSSCAPSARRCRRSPIAEATAPPTPRSISSKIIVVAPPASASATFSARMKRDSSPPLAIFASGAKGAPGLVEISNSTRSRPDSPALFE